MVRAMTQMYSFHPQTNEGKNREVLERVLQEQSEDDIGYFGEEAGVSSLSPLSRCVCVCVCVCLRCREKKLHIPAHVLPSCSSNRVHGPSVRF